MFTNCNILAIRTCNENRTGFRSEALKFTINAKRYKYKRLVDNWLLMVITRRRDSKNLQEVSDIMQSISSTEDKKNRSNMIKAECYNDVIHVKNI